MAVAEAAINQEVAWPKQTDLVEQGPEVPRQGYRRGAANDALVTHHLVDPAVDEAAVAAVAGDRNPDAFEQGDGVGVELRQQTGPADRLR